MKKIQLLMIVAAALVMVSFIKPVSQNGADTQLIDYTGATVLNMCTGEVVHFSGSMLLVNAVNGNGSNYSVTTIAKPQNLSFVSASGETFKAIGVTVFRNKASLTGGKIVVSANNNMLFIGDRGTKYMLNESGRIVYNADLSLDSYNYDRHLRCD